jgi:RNA polymerase sigma-70 factor, ECF subfamily
MIAPHDIAPLRRLLFSTAYKMTGEVAASEDLVQDALLPLLTTPEQFVHVRDPRSYLLRAVVNASLTYLKRQETRRKAYKGPWLPEPLLTDDHNWDQQLDIDYGLTVLMSRLSPGERAIFILREAFDLPFREIAEWLDENETRIRKRYQRSLPKLGAWQRLHPVAQEEKAALLEALMHTLATGDFAPLIARLRADITVWSDGGGKAAAATQPLHGIDTCLKFLLGIYQKQPGGLHFRPARINGLPGMLVYEANGEKPVTVLICELQEAHIAELFLIRNPDKIQFFVPKPLPGWSS